MSLTGSIVGFSRRWNCLESWLFHNSITSFSRYWSWLVRRPGLVAFTTGGQLGSREDAFSPKEGRKQLRVTIPVYIFKPGDSITHNATVISTGFFQSNTFTSLLHFHTRENFHTDTIEFSKMCMCAFVCVCVCMCLCLCLRVCDINDLSIFCAKVLTWVSRIFGNIVSDIHYGSKLMWAHVLLMTIIQLKMLNRLYNI